MLVNRSYSTPYQHKRTNRPTPKNSHHQSGTQISSFPSRKVDRFMTGALLTACGTVAGIAGAILSAATFPSGLLMVLGGTAAALACSTVFLD